jgi:hypothetical protein
VQPQGTLRGRSRGRSPAAILDLAAVGLDESALPARKGRIAICRNWSGMPGN